MKKILPFFLLLSVSFVLHAQTETEEVIIPPCNLEIIAEFPGGQDAFNKYLHRTIAKKNDKKLRSIYDTLRGPSKAYAKFTVTETGEIADVYLEVSTKSSYIDSLFISALQNMPRWTPTSQNGKNVKVEFTIPLKIDFK
ncbi:MAG: hypothetical protein AB7G44_14710 [Bacteroidia bacterium]